MRWVLCAAVWLIMMAGALVVVSNDWGPILLTLSHKNAIRWTDVLAVVLGAAIGLAGTYLAWVTAPDKDAASIAARWVLCGVVWLVAMATSLYVASETKLGPVVLNLSHNHGVHLSDAFVVLFGAAIATAFSWAAWVTAPRRNSAGLVGSLRPPVGGCLLYR